MDQNQYILRFGPNNQLVVPDNQQINAWEEYKSRLRASLPSHSVFLRKWWRNRLIECLRRQLNAKNMNIPRYKWRTEEQLWKEYPWARNKWNTDSIRLQVLCPTYQQFINRWFERKMRDFFVRTMNLNRRRNRRNHFRIDLFLVKLFLCEHRICYAIRLNAMFWISIAMYLIFILIEE
jgi:hypothetical protein